MKACDLIGQKFGKLTVTERLAESRDRYQLWLCACDCGGMIKANTRDLKRGTVSNCGCIPKRDAKHGQKAEDLTGRRFGRLLVLSRAPNKNRRTRWRCLCDCGREHITTAHELKNGKCTSCGCEWHKGASAVDLTGRKFGQMTALYPLEKRSRKGSVYWHCRCSCGRETDVTEDALCHGEYKSCGCLKEAWGKQLYTQLTLIDGTCVEILKNRKYRSDNTSGFRGVSVIESGRFRASIGFKGDRFYLGTYDTMQDAVQARLAAEEQIHEGFVNAYYAWQERAGQDPAWGEANPLHFEVEKVDGEIRVRTNM